VIAILLALWAASPPGTPSSVSQTPDTALNRQLGIPLATLRDSLFAVQGSGAAFRRDLAVASPDLVIARARRVQESCAGAGVAVAAALRALAATTLPPRTQPRSADFQRLLPKLQADLARCQREFAPGAWYTRVDSLRAWGPSRTVQLDANVRHAVDATDHLRAVLGYKS
jgi:hypothetical protein